MSSRQIDSNQQAIHTRLEAIVSKHLRVPFRRPIADYSRRVFDAHFHHIDDFAGPLVFDSCCGVGESTAHLARAMPEALIVGIDKSAHRLGKHDAHYRRAGVDNYLLIRADIDDFWRQALQAGWRLQRHFLLYPNPWPKASQFKRRCHGSPLFPTLLALGGILEVRSNWRLYIEEFGAALTVADLPWSAGPGSGGLGPGTPAITPFERKYGASGQVLWRLHCELD